MDDVDGKEIRTCDFCKQSEISSKPYIYWEIIKKSSCEKCFNKARKEEVAVVCKRKDDTYPLKPKYKRPDVLITEIRKVTSRVMVGEIDAISGMRTIAVKAMKFLKQDCN